MVSDHRPEFHGYWQLKLNKTEKERKIDPGKPVKEGCGKWHNRNIPNRDIS